MHSRSLRMIDGGAALPVGLQSVSPRSLLTIGGHFPDELVAASRAHARFAAEVAAQPLRVRPKRPQVRAASRTEVLAVAIESTAVMRRSATLPPLDGSLVAAAFYDVCWRSVPWSWEARARDMIAVACRCLGADTEPEPLFYERIHNDQPTGFAAYGSPEIALAIDAPRADQPYIVGHEVFHTIDPLQHGREERAEKAGEAIASAWYNLNMGV